MKQIYFKTQTNAQTQNTHAHFHTTHIDYTDNFGETE